MERNLLANFVKVRISASSIIQSRQCLSVRLSVRLSHKISVTTGPIEFYSSGNIPTDPVVVLSYFLGGWDNPPSPPPKKIHLNFFSPNGSGHIKIFFKITLWNKELEARGEAASKLIQKRL